MIGNIAALVIANYAIEWNIPYVSEALTGRWEDVLGILNLSLALSAICYAVCIFYDERRFYYAARMALDVIGIIVLYRLITVFPFDFTTIGIGWLNTVARIGFGIGIFGVIVSIITRTARLVTGKNIYF